MQARSKFLLTIFQGTSRVHNNPLTILPLYAEWYNGLDDVTYFVRRNIRRTIFNKVGVFVFIQPKYCFSFSGRFWSFPPSPTVLISHRLKVLEIMIPANTTSTSPCKY